MQNFARLALLVLGLVALARPLGAEAPRDPYPWLGRTPPRELVYPELLITAQALARLPAAERPLALDLRPEPAFLRGHLPGARGFDSAAAPLAAAIAAGEAGPIAAWLGAQGIGAGTPLLLYADGLGLPAIGHAFWLLEWAGCAMPRVLAGGIEGWTRQGGELETSAGMPVPPVAPPAPRPALGVGPAWIAASLGETHTCEVLDLRGKAAWAGAEGHIPHALAADLPLLLGAGEDWPAPAAAREAFSRFGPRPRDFVDLDATFVLCGWSAADPSPGLGYLLLRLIDVKATVQLGGWAAWRADSTLPTTRILDTAAMRALLAAGNPQLADRRQARLPLFDLRGHRDFQREHLPGALALPANVVDDSLSLRIAASWPEAEPGVDSLAFYCYGPECVRSRIAATKAARLGWLRTLIYLDGVPAWRRAGLPLPGRGPQPPSPRPAGERR
jgi:3-mercaptopyruvate sulfurtransferase SseA